MSDDTKTNTTKRTTPRKRSMRAAIDLTTRPGATDRIIAGAKARYIRILKAQADFNDWVDRHVMKGIIERYNEGVADPAKRLDTLVLYDERGDNKLAVERQITRSLDSRADMARALVEEYLAEVEGKTIDLSEDAAIVYELLRGIFFGRRGFKFTPQLFQFILIDPDRIKDERLAKAQQLLKGSIHTNKNQWYAHVYEFDEQEREYVKVSI